MDIAVIENGVVVNAIVVEPQIWNGVYMSALEFAQMLLPTLQLAVLPPGAGIGWLYDGETFTAP